MHGTLAAAVPLQTLAERVAEIVGRVPIAFPGGPERVRTLAICSGRPGGIALEAAAVGADALLTGEPQEDFRALARELGMSIVCAGHHATETLGVRAAGRAGERALRSRARLPRRHRTPSEARFAPASSHTNLLLLPTSACGATIARMEGSVYRW